MPVQNFLFIALDDCPSFEILSQFGVPLVTPGIDQLRAVGTDDLCAHIRRVGDDDVIRFGTAEQPAHEVVEHMVQEAAEAKVQDGLRMFERQAPAGLSQRQMVCFKSEDFDRPIKSV